MTFAPRIPPEILSQLLARVIASNEAGLTDVSEGGVLATILGSVAQEVANLELRISTLASNFFLDLTGADLDRRLEEFPSSFARRMPSTAAQGGAFTLRRDVRSTLPQYPELTIPARSIIVTASSNPSITYTNINAIYFALDQVHVENQPFISLATGARSNLMSLYAIDTITSGGGLLEVTNTAPITGGSDREPDELLRLRAQQWLASLALCQPLALESLARSFVSSSNSRVTHARMWTDPDMPGYSELVIDDGNGMAGYTQNANTTSGTLPTLQGDGNRYTLFFHYPAATPPVVTIGGTNVPPSMMTLAPEKGVLYLNASNSFTPGQAWSITGHQVFTGILAELQQLINDTAVAAGTRVRVVPPMRQVLTITGDLTVITGSDINAVRNQVKANIVAFVASLAPGEPLLMYRLIGFLNRVPGVLNIVFDQTDRYPGSIREKLITTVESITLR